ncbi:MAG TPA: hypothetical protein EYM58_08325 [Rhodospirillales bacterium]|nr:hypothetical protein [Rhodospirillales bacterium]
MFNDHILIDFLKNNLPAAFAVIIKPIFNFGGGARGSTDDFQPHTSTIKRFSAGRRLPSLLAINSLLSLTPVFVSAPGSIGDSVFTGYKAISLTATGIRFVSLFFFG